MSGNGFYILIFILLIVFIIPAEVLIKFFLFGLLIIVAILAFAGYKLNKAFKKFKEQSTQHTYDDQTDDSTETKDVKSKIAGNDEFDMSKSNIIDTEYEDL